MKLFRYFAAFVLMLCVVFSLCACGGSGNGEDKTAGETVEKTTEESTEATTEEVTVDDGKVAYSIKVVDTEGKPIVGALVQMCSDTCFPAATNDSGVAEFSLKEADYKVTFLTLPAGYVYSDEKQEFHFEDGATELTIVLKAAE